MYNKIEVFEKQNTQAHKLLNRLKSDFGVEAENIEISEVFYISNLTKNQLNDAASNVFSDPITQVVEVDNDRKIKGVIAEVSYLPGVMDPVAMSAEKALKDSGVKKEIHVKTAKRYYLYGLDEKEAEAIVRNTLANENIQEYRIGPRLPNKKEEMFEETKETIEQVEMLNADEAKLEQISKDMLLSLTIEEMNAIKKYFALRKRNPTDAELETIAQTWSEHCKHKTFNSDIVLENNGKKEHINNLFKSTIVESTTQIAKKKNWLISVFKDNAGIISFDDKNNVAFKVETHNHPSALDPYGGAGTGVGGVIRDVLGAGLGAEPIFTTDVFCLARPDFEGELFPGIIHPKRILKGVVSGVRDYGNRMGIPTINGSINFHANFLGAPLVFCGTAGLIPKGMEKKKAAKNDLIVVLGGRTGRDGIHGATFSSTELGQQVKTSVVQIGNAIEEKKILDALLRARNQKLYTHITDCGAGGFSSAIGESAEELGCTVNLEKAPLKYKGLKPWEIWLSESQERMIMAVPKKNIKKFMDICRMEDVEATIIGKFDSDKKLKVLWKGKKLVELEMYFLHKGLPKQKRFATVTAKKLQEPKLKLSSNLNTAVLEVISHPTIASKEAIIRQYDHEVQGLSALKPLTGLKNDGPSDAAAIRPANSDKAIVVANGINPRYSAIDSYWMAASAIDEALRNITASGGDITRTALLDNFCWSNTDEGDKLGSMVMAAKACKDFAIEYETPFISGKDSLHNEFKLGKIKMAIPDTLLISAISVINDAKKIVTSDFKDAGNSIYVVGITYDELGGSYYYNLFDEVGANVPIVRKTARLAMTKLNQAMQNNFVRSCHDCSEGGFIIALSEMAFSGGLGANIELAKIPVENVKREDTALFSESNSRFIVEVRPENEQEFEKIMKGTAVAKIGTTTGTEQITVRGFDGNIIVNLATEEIKERWKAGLKYD